MVNPRSLKCCMVDAITLRYNVPHMKWTSELAYAVGLLTTDGSLSKDGRHIDLTSKDVEQLIEEGVQVFPEIMVPQVCTAEELKWVYSRLTDIRREMEEAHKIEIHFNEENRFN